LQAPYVLCLLAPAPYFHVFFRCLEILHHLLLAEDLLPSPLPTSDDSANNTPVATATDLAATLPIESAAANFLTGLHIALADPPPPGSILLLALPRRSDYALAALPTITTDVPRPGEVPLPPTLTHGDDFAEVQIPPSVTAGGAALRACLACLWPDACLYSLAKLAST
jgi:hypothetical protein